MTSRYQGATIFAMYAMFFVMRSTYHVGDPGAQMHYRTFANAAKAIDRHHASPALFLRAVFRQS